MNAEAMDAFDAGLTFDEYAASVNVHRAALLEHYARLSGLVHELQADSPLPESPLADVRILAIVEDWCPDCVFNVPIVARLAEASDSAALRIVRRRDHRALADRFLGRGGVNRLPTFVFLGADGNVTGYWSERCASSERWFASFSKANPMPPLEIEGDMPAPALLDWMQLRIAREGEQFRAGAWRDVLREMRLILEAARFQERMSPMYQGSCLCGGVCYELTREPGPFGYCHCTSCRKASGSAHAANAPIDRHDFRLVSGDALIREYESSPGKFRAFCTNCGSPLYAYLAQTPDVLRIRLGGLDTPFARTAQAHTWVSDKAAWDEIGKPLPQFATWADKAVLDQRGTRQAIDT